MSLLICAATPKELAAMAPGIFPDPGSIEEMRPIASSQGRRSLVFLATGIGPVNAAMAIGYAFGLLLDQKKNSPPPIRAVLYGGLAGAFALDKTPLRSICVVRKEIWPEYGLHDGTTVTARAFRFPLWARKDQDDIYDTVSLADLSALGQFPAPCEKWPECSSLTVAGVSASFARRDRLQNLYGAELENMEGFAAAYAALRADLPCVEVRVVSNKVGPRGRNEKDFDGALQTLGQVLPALNIL